jgi:uncharacterized membrane protein
MEPGSETQEAAFYSIELRPNCALSVRGALLFFASLCLVCFSIAGLFTALGFWPVLPFAGLEMLLLGWALAWSMRQRNVIERIEISHSQVTAEARRPRSHERIVFPRHWAKVTLRASHTALHPSRLFIESQGRVFEVGRFLVEEERRALAARLQQLIGNMNSSPPLATPAAARADEHPAEPV